MLWHVNEKVCIANGEKKNEKRNLSARSEPQRSADATNHKLSYRKKRRNGKMFEKKKKKEKEFVVFNRNVFLGDTTLRSIPESPLEITAMYRNVRNKIKCEVEIAVRAKSKKLSKAAHFSLSFVS